jgi:hypothetical protein
MQARVQVDGEVPGGIRASAALAICREKFPDLKFAVGAAVGRAPICLNQSANIMGHVVPTLDESVPTAPEEEDRRCLPAAPRLGHLALGQLDPAERQRTPHPNCHPSDGRRPSSPRLQDRLLSVRIVANSLEPYRE